LGGKVVGIADSGDVALDGDRGAAMIADGVCPHR